MIELSLLVLLLPAEENPTPKVPIGKETTYVTGPVTKEGYIDFEAALNERMSKGVTPATNANVLIWKALGPRPEGGDGMPKEYWKYLDVEEPPLEGEYLINENDYLRKQGITDSDSIIALSEAIDSARRQVWTAKEHPQVAAWLTANEKPLALFLEASRRPKYFNPLVAPRRKDQPPLLIGSLLPNVQKVRAAARALAARAMLALGEGKTAEAWRDLQACHRLGRLVANGGTLIEMLVGIALDNLASQADLVFLDRARGNGEQIRGWLRDLQALPPMPRFVDRLNLGERFTYLDCVQFIRRAGPAALQNLDQGKPFTPEPGQEAAMAGIDWEPAFRDGNRWYDRMTEAALQKSRRERQVAFAQIEKDLRTLRGGKVGNMRLDLALAILGGDGPVGKLVGKKISEILVTLLLPAVNKVQDAADRIEQTQQNLHVAFALAAYRAEKGSYPEKLEALAPAYLPRVPDDLFSGGALIYQPTRDGFLLYSVGVNGRDEQGLGYEDEPRGDDLNVRIPVPAPKKKE